MGCGGSKASTRVHDQRPPPTRELKQANTDDKPETSKQQGPLTEEHIAVVQNTWKYVKSDLQEVGIIFYTRYSKTPFSIATMIHQTSLPQILGIYRLLLEPPRSDSVNARTSDCEKNKTLNRIMEFALLYCG